MLAASALATRRLCDHEIYALTVLFLSYQQEAEEQYDPEDPRKREKSYPFAKQTQSNPGEEWK